MSNDLTALPFIIDTPGPDPISSKQYAILWIRWVAPKAKAGDACLITSRNGRTIWESVASGPRHVETEHWAPGSKLNMADGLTVPILDSGTIYFGIA